MIEQFINDVFEGLECLLDPKTRLPSKYSTEILQTIDQIKAKTEDDEEVQVFKAND